MVVSSDEFKRNEKHKKTYFTYEQRKQLLEAIRYVDLAIPEENWQQKRSDMHEYHVDTFVMGDDWKGKFDFLKELDRFFASFVTPFLSSMTCPRCRAMSSKVMKRKLSSRNRKLLTFHPKSIII